MSLLESLILASHKYDSDTIEVLKSIDEIQDGESQDDNFLYFRCGENIKIYDRVCDHNGGRLSIREGGASCPLHGWKLDLSSGFYTNASCSKKTILEVNEYELDSPLISIPITSRRLKTESWSSELITEIRFLNHACLVFRMGDISFATDPWILGSAFCNGWWLAKSSPTDAFETINKCDFIYISHNHPDHLHPESLKRIRKDMPILTGDFLSGSTKSYLHDLGFFNVVAMDFVSTLIDSEREIQLSVLKSGDFRDDSGLFIQHGKFTCLLTVDSNFLNFGNLPFVDLLCSSFAGGASGFPLCFENYTEEEKKSVVTRNKGAIKATNISNLRVTKASFFMPYAGFFTEAAERDSYVKGRNFKNSVDDFEKICTSNDSSLLNLNKEQMFVLVGSRLISRKLDETEKMSSSKFGLVVEYDSEQIDIQLNEVVLDYFEGCNFKDDLLVDLRPTNDDFSLVNLAFKLDFSSKKYSKYDFASHTKSLEEEAKERGLRYLQIKVRKQELLDVILNGKPWEDLSIGFQCRIFRVPNVYNSEFWFHFTNVYVGKNIVRSALIRLNE